jgi:hypothetical protein
MWFSALSLLLVAARDTYLNSMNRIAFIAFVLFSAIATSTGPSRADFTIDLRAVSGSQITIDNPKSVAVNQNSVGGWIDFELYAIVKGTNGSAKDESIHSFVGNMLSTHSGNGAVGGSMVNSGEIDARMHRGILPPLDHVAHSNGLLQNLDDDPDLEIGGNGYQPWQNYTSPFPFSTYGMIAGRGDPFRPNYYVGQLAVAEFLLYRFTLPIETFLATDLDDLTAIHFQPGTGYAGIWREDSVSKSRANGGIVRTGESVLIHTVQTPEQLVIVPEPCTWLLALAGLLSTCCLAIRRRN